MASGEMDRGKLCAQKESARRSLGFAIDGADIGGGAVIRVCHCGKARLIWAAMLATECRLGHIVKRNVRASATGLREKAL
jgi:hypothetical protein